MPYSFVTPWTVAHQAPLFMGFSRQEYWSGLPCTPPGGGSSWPNQTYISYVSCIGRQVLDHYRYLGSPKSESVNHSVVSDSATPRNAVHQAPLSKGFPRQKDWNGLPFPSPGDLPNPEIEPGLFFCRRILSCLSHQRSSAGFRVGPKSHTSVIYKR